MRNVLKSRDLSDIVLMDLSESTNEAMQGSDKTVLQLTREAIQTATSFVLGPLQMIHILFSTLALLLYIPTTILGFKIYRGKEEETTRENHKKYAILALFSRTIGLLFMFSM